MNDDIANLPDHTTQYGIRLCHAVKSHRCLYDPQSQEYRVKNANKAAWKLVAKECNDTVANCRFRWKTINNAFTRSYKKFGDKSDYYLYAYLLFLIPFLGAGQEKNDDSILNDDANKSQAEADKNENNGCSDSDTIKSADEPRKTPTMPVLQNITNDTQAEKAREQIVVKEKELKQDPKSPHKRTVGFHDDIMVIDPPIVEEESNDIKPLADKVVQDHEGEIKNSKIIEIFSEENPLADNTDSQPSPSPSDDNAVRRLRDRKVPKRFIEMDFSPDKSTEKRPRRIMQRRKSVGGLMLKEFALKNSLPDFPSPPTKPIFAMPKPLYTPEVPSFCDTTVDDHNLFRHNSLSNHTAFSQDSSAMATAVMVDGFTMTDDSHREFVNVGIQCEAVPRRPDDEFLESLRPQMDTMNLRQKVNFKRRVYMALMDVLDDATNFPNDNEIFEAAVKVETDFQATTSSELKLMRELVAIVQAAKTTSDLIEIQDKRAHLTSVTQTIKSIPATITLVNSPTAPATPTAEKTISSPPSTTSPDRNSSQSQPVGPVTTTINNPLGIPRHVIQKAVKVAGSNGSTIMTHDGEKRRVYRIYPKNVTGAPATQSTPPTQTSTPNNSQSGTFFLTPPHQMSNKPSVATPLNQSNATPTSNFKSMPYTPPPPAINRITHNNTAASKTMLPPSTNRSPAFSNSFNKPQTMTPPQRNVVSNEGRAKIIQRRYSICGAAPTRNQPIRVATKPYARPGTMTAQPPPLQRIHQFPHEQEFRQHLANQQMARQQVSPAGSTAQSAAATGITSNFSNMSKIQLSKPVSLNMSAHTLPEPIPTPPQPIKHIPAINDNCRPRMVPSSPLAVVEPKPAAIPDSCTARGTAGQFLSPSEESVLQMAGTIAADNFGGVFNKPIKTEPEE